MNLPQSLRHLYAHTHAHARTHNTISLAQFSPFFLCVHLLLSQVEPYDTELVQCKSFLMVETSIEWYRGDALLIFAIRHIQLQLSPRPTHQKNILTSRIKLTLNHFLADPWYVGNAKRARIENGLKELGIPGDFVVRKSSQVIYSPKRVFFFVVKSKNIFLKAVSFFSSGLGRLQFTVLSATLVCRRVATR